MRAVAHVHLVLSCYGRAGAPSRVVYVIPSLALCLWALADGVRRLYLACTHRSSQPRTDSSAEHGIAVSWPPPTGTLCSPVRVSFLTCRPQGQARDLDTDDVPLLDPTQAPSVARLTAREKFASDPFHLHTAILLLGVRGKRPPPPPPTGHIAWRTARRVGDAVKALGVLVNTSTPRLKAALFVVTPMLLSLVCVWAGMCKSFAESVEDFISGYHCCGYNECFAVRVCVCADGPHCVVLQSCPSVPSSRRAVPGRPSAGIVHCIGFVLRRVSQLPACEELYEQRHHSQVRVLVFCGQWYSVCCIYVCVPAPHHDGIPPGRAGVAAWRSSCTGQEHAQREQDHPRCCWICRIPDGVMIRGPLLELQCPCLTCSPPPLLAHRYLLCLDGSSSALS